MVETLYDIAMKKISLWALGLIFCVVFSLGVSAQEIVPDSENKTFKVKKHTVMEQYEPAMVLSVNERIRLKQERFTTIKRRRGILDTLDISDRRRQRLLKELVRNPFSDRLNRAVADIEFIE
jgi:hypothetical protein